MLCRDGPVKIGTYASSADRLRAFFNIPPPDTRVYFQHFEVFVTQYMELETLISVFPKCTTIMGKRGKKRI